jgi:hypothetical protein
MAATAVELQAQYAMGIKAETDHAWGVAGLEAGDRALAPLAGVAHAGVVVVAVEVGITKMQVEGRTFDEAISLVFICLGGEGIVAVNAMNSGVKRNAEGTGTSSFGLAVGQFLFLNVRLFIGVRYGGADS